MTKFDNCWGIHMGEVWLENSLSQTFSHMDTPTVLKLVILHLPAYEDGTDSVP